MMMSKIIKNSFGVSTERKFQYRILARIKGRDYLIWSYSKHYSNDMKHYKKRKLKSIMKRLGTSSIDEYMGLAHANTALNWVLSVEAALRKGTHTTSQGYEVTKDGKFNPHFRLNKISYPPKWFDIKDVNKIFYEMSVYDVEKEVW
jgi:hypothetical protein